MATGDALEPLPIKADMEALRRISRIPSAVHEAMAYIMAYGESGRISFCRKFGQLGRLNNLLGRVICPDDWLQEFKSLIDNENSSVEKALSENSGRRRRRRLAETFRKHALAASEKFDWYFGYSIDRNARVNFVSYALAEWIKGMQPFPLDETAIMAVFYQQDKNLALSAFVEYLNKQSNVGFRILSHFLHVVHCVMPVQPEAQLQLLSEAYDILFGKQSFRFLESADWAKEVLRLLLVKKNLVRTLKGRVCRHCCRSSPAIVGNRVHLPIVLHDLMRHALTFGRDEGWGSFACVANAECNFDRLMEMCRRGCRLSSFFTDVQNSTGPLPFVSAVLACVNRLKDSPDPLIPHACAVRMFEVAEHSGGPRAESEALKLFNSLPIISRYYLAHLRKFFAQLAANSRQMELSDFVDWLAPHVARTDGTIEAFVRPDSASRCLEMIFHLPDECVREYEKCATCSGRQ